MIDAMAARQVAINNVLKLYDREIKEIESTIGAVVLGGGFDIKLPRETPQGIIKYLEYKDYNVTVGTESYGDNGEFKKRYIYIISW